MRQLQFPPHALLLPVAFRQPHILDRGTHLAGDRREELPVAGREAVAAGAVSQVDHADAAERTGL